MNYCYFQIISLKVRRVTLIVEYNWRKIKKKNLLHFILNSVMITETHVISIEIICYSYTLL